MAIARECALGYNTDLVMVIKILKLKPKHFLGEGVSKNAYHN